MSIIHPSFSNYQSKPTTTTEPNINNLPPTSLVKEAPLLAAEPPVGIALSAPPTEDALGTTPLVLAVARTVAVEVGMGELSALRVGITTVLNEAGTRVVGDMISVEVWGRSRRAKSAYQRGSETCYLDLKRPTCRKRRTAEVTVKRLVDPPAPVSVKV